MLVAPPTQPLDPLIGRAEEITELEAALAQSRLVTLTGLGGAGKTRVARELVARAASRGVAARFVDLAPVADVSELPAAIAAVVGVREAAEVDLATAIADELRRSSSLMVLDNFEHLLPGRAFVATLLASAEPLRILTTSRVRLSLPGERALTLEPLPLPATADGLEASDAGRLFLRRAGERGGLAALAEADRATVVEICRLLDGLPLALELAAAWTRILGPRAILLRLGEGRLALGGADDDRHASLEDVVEATLALVEPDDAAAFDSLAVFAGGFDEPAAVEVTGVDDTLSVLRRLEAVALVRVVQEVEGEPRFGMLETIRTIAGRRLAARAGEDVARRRHAAYFARWVEPRAEALRRSADSSARTAVATEAGNLVAAEAHAVAVGDRSLALVLATAMAVIGRRSPGGLRAPAARLERALAAGSASPRARCEGLMALAWLRYEISSAPPEVDEVTAESLGLARSVGDPLLLVRALIVRATTAGRPDAVALFEEAGELAIRHDLPWEAASAFNNAADVLGRQGRLADARQLCTRAIALSAESGDLFGHALARLNAGEIDANLGRVDDAAGSLEVAVEAFRVASPGVHLSRSLSVLAAVEALRGRAAEAERRLHEAARIVATTESVGAILEFLADAVTVLVANHPAVAARALGAVRRAEVDAVPLIGQPLLEAAASSVRRALGQVRFEAECGTGATTPMLTVFEEVSAILEAVTLDRDAARAARIRAPYGLLTPREAEVLTLLARGRTDGEIAAELYISPKTASVHVANIKGKLGVDTRVEAALLARELVGA